MLFLVSANDLAFSLSLFMFMLYLLNSFLKIFRFFLSFRIFIVYFRYLSHFFKFFALLFHFGLDRMILEFVFFSFIEFVKYFVFYSYVAWSFLVYACWYILLALFMSAPIFCYITFAYPVDL